MIREQMGMNRTGLFTMQPGREISTNLSMANKVDYFNSIMNSLADDTLSNSKTDMTVLITGPDMLAPIPVHASILASQSKFLSSLIHSATELVILLPGVESSTVKCMLDLLYRGRLVSTMPCSIHPETVPAKCRQINRKSL